ncbi:MAG: cation:proton antiporter [Chitinophagaceae bacterium]|nr:cation:proton antiporter [Chitinophagaceae bacterium]
MTISIIITISILLLLAYVFDITASKTKIPSVILLLLLGFGAKLITESLNISVPNLNPILPILGTIGLILIVLEGSLELEINKSKLPLIFKSSIVALIPLLVISFAIAYYLNHFENLPLKLALANAIPLGIISSAIAIPSARNLLSNEKEFITYESSLSDIFGVIFFNFITLNDNIGSQSFGNFAIELLEMLVISFIATLLLAGFLNKIKHHIKFVPMIILVLLIYGIAKLFHLPALIFILIFGLFIGNIDELRHYKFIQKFHPVNFSKDVHKFREITTELAFLIRALFFMLFGFLINVEDVLNSETILFAVCITAGIFLVRFLILKLFKIQTNPLIFIAPRGLITILLFLSIPISQQIEQIDKSLIIQVIILSAFIMMIGLMRYKKPQIDNINESH